MGVTRAAGLAALLALLTACQSQVLGRDREVLETVERHHQRTLDGHIDVAGDAAVGAITPNCTSERVEVSEIVEVRETRPSVPMTTGIYAVGFGSALGGVAFLINDDASDDGAAWAAVGVGVAGLITGFVLDAVDAREVRVGIGERQEESLGRQATNCPTDLVQDLWGRGVTVLGDGARPLGTHPLDQNLRFPFPLDVATMAEASGGRFAATVEGDEDRVWFEPEDQRAMYRLWQVNTVDRDPPWLEVDVSLDDSAGNGNGYLDPGETASLLVAVSNQGGDAYAVTIAAAEPQPEWLTLGTLNAGDILAGDVATGSIPIEARLDAPASAHAVVLVAQEAGGFDSSEVSVSLQVEAYLPPQYDISAPHLVEVAGNGNGVFEANELVRVTLPLRNSGQVPTDFEVSLTGVTPGRVQGESTRSGRIGAGESEEFGFEFVVPASELRGDDQVVVAYEIRAGVRAESRSYDATFEIGELAERVVSAAADSASTDRRRLRVFFMEELGQDAALTRAVPVLQEVLTATGWIAIATTREQQEEIWACLEEDLASPTECRRVLLEWARTAAFDYAISLATTTRGRSERQLSLTVTDPLRSENLRVFQGTYDDDASLRATLRALAREFVQWAEALE